VKIYYSTLFEEKVQALDYRLKKVLRKKLELMAQDINYPSLRIKKIQGTAHLFEASITRGCRMTWQHYKDGILLRNIGEHDETLKNP